MNGLLTTPRARGEQAGKQATERARIGGLQHSRQRAYRQAE